MWRAWEKREMQAKFWSRNLKGRDHLEDSGANERTILKRILGKECECVDFIHPTQDKFKWWDLVYTVTDLLVS
jgi:hypothetical protein